MAISTYAELQTAAVNYLDRPDLAGDRVQEFIALAEARLRRELKEWLRAKISATNVTGDYTVAATVEAVLGVAYNDGAGGVYNHELAAITFADYHGRMSCDSAVRAPARFFYPERDESANTYVIRFYPPVSSGSPIDALVLDVVGHLPALSDSQTTNRLLTEAPDCYLWGSLCEAAKYLQHDERAGMWEMNLAGAIVGLRGQAERKLTSNRPREISLPRVFG